MITATKQTAKQIAKQVAKQIANEPFEILKAARSQIENAPAENRPERPAEEQKQKAVSGEEKQKKELQAQRLVNAYQSEIEDIRKQELFKDLQRRIAQGEDIPLAGYAVLTPEQRQVLEAQKQPVANRKTGAEVQQKESIPQIISKRGRKMFGKIGLKREQTKVEMRQPPSS